MHLQGSAENHALGLVAEYFEKAPRDQHGIQISGKDNVGDDSIGF